MSCDLEGSLAQFIWGLAIPSILDLVVEPQIINSIPKVRLVTVIGQCCGRCTRGSMSRRNTELSHSYIVMKGFLALS